VTSYEGRPLRPEDNGKISETARAAPFPVLHQPLRRAGSKPLTQLEAARAGLITKEMVYVAARENEGRKAVKAVLEQTQIALREGEAFGATLPDYVTPESVRTEIAAGRAIMPANINHPELGPMIIGRHFLVKSN